MTIALEKKQCIIAGNGILPVKMAQSAKENGFEVFAISLSADNKKLLEKHCYKVLSFGCGQVEKIQKALQDEGIKQLTFLGKVNKSMLLKRPLLDATAIKLMMEMQRLNDDAVMLKIIEELNKLDITVLDQTIFIKNLMVPRGILTRNEPSEEQKTDIEYGYRIAKEIGKLDIGQSVVIKDRMVMAVEAIEGTDKCIKRGCKLARRKDAVVVKVAKPKQDKRFDIPAVGLKTLKTMKKYGANVLALEANETIIVDQQEMVKYADRNKITVVAV